MRYNHIRLSTYSHRVFYSLLWNLHRFVAYIFNLTNDMQYAKSAKRMLRGTPEYNLNCHSLLTAQTRQNLKCILENRHCECFYLLCQHQIRHLLFKCCDDIRHSTFFILLGSIRLFKMCDFYFWIMLFTLDWTFI